MWNWDAIANANVLRGKWLQESMPACLVGALFVIVKLQTSRRNVSSSSDNAWHGSSLCSAILDIKICAVCNQVITKLNSMGTAFIDLQRRRKLHCMWCRGNWSCSWTAGSPVCRSRTVSGSPGWTEARSRCPQVLDLRWSPCWSSPTEILAYLENWHFRSIGISQIVNN